MNQKKTSQWLFAANWKMNKTVLEANCFINNVFKDLQNKSSATQIVICASNVLIPVLKNLQGSGVAWELGAQNVHHEREGAYTGDCSALQIKDSGADWVILGHSERRSFYGKCEEAFLGKKISLGLENNLKIIFCIGETLEQRKADKTLQVLREQIASALESVKSVSPISVDNFVIAYEPVWAIGTGLSASIKQIVEVHEFVKKQTQKTIGLNNVKVLYGGSVTLQNYGELYEQESVNGVLVGGASLKQDVFLKMATFPLVPV